ncbi:hypothetical protein ABL78_2977 [Leptomonas seymouri]|uniref:Flagellar calcium-binding protein n=1 Tax=Leptomonas seymouri TaxID=5684 RepID=A0A0N1HYI6_LEPSE|nr:hypothetical protein ABL78_2977 [Leptomonas seymouri]|eukprot:KPI87938.1 hypothetical protein ABL78_2977 [Leptomonas seymouri]
MITCCEFFHVLDVFQELKALPKAVKSFMKSLPGGLKCKNGRPLSELGGDADDKLQYELIARAWKEGAAALITTEMLTPKVLGALKTQIPSVFARAGAQDIQDNLLTATSLIILAGEYERRLEETMNLHSSNPLYTSGGEDLPASPSFLAFVEWAALQCALSVCGPEEDPGSYGVVQVESSEGLKHQIDAMHLWRQRLHRLETVEEQLAKLELLGDSSEKCSALLVKKEIMAEIEELFALWCGDRPFLTAAEVEERCFEMLDVGRTLPDRRVHNMLSTKAFEEAIKGSDTDTIDTAGKLRQYLKTYFELQDLYCNTVLNQQDALEKDGERDISCLPSNEDLESSQEAIWGSPPHHDVELHPLKAAECDEKDILSVDEGTESSQQLFNTKSTGGLVPAEQFLVLLHPIEELGSAIGLTDAKGQARFIASFLHQVFILSDNRLSNCGTTLAAEALETAVELLRYTDYSSIVGVMAIRFACLNPSHWGLFAVKESPSSDLFVKWLYKIRSEAVDRLSLDEHINCHFLVRALFSIAAAQRAFEDTVADEAADRPSRSNNTRVGEGKARAPKVYEATESHFVRAIASMCKYLDCSAETLLHNCSALLSQSENGNNDTNAPQDLSVAVESAFSSLCEAYAQFKGVAGAESEDIDGVEAEPMVCIQHVLFVVAFNYTQLHCGNHWRTGNVYDFNDDVAIDVNGEPVPKWAAEKELLALSNTMPLHCMNIMYREFAELTNSCTNDCDCNGEGGAEEAFRQKFLAAFYEHYKLHFAELDLSESAVTEIGRRAFQYITNSPNRAGGAKMLTRNDYNGFLQFVLGQVMMQKAYECTVRRSGTQAGFARYAVEEEVFLSDRHLRHMLACFTRLTDGGACNVPSAEMFQTWLQSRGFDSDEGLISLDDACLWYGAHRIESYALESLFSWWKGKMALRVPFTVSTAHRFARLSAMREILRIKQHRESLSEDEPVELAEDEDGYLPAGMISYVMNKRGFVDEITQRVFHVLEQDSAAEGAAARGNGAETQGVDGAFKVVAWIKSCICGMNAVVHRSDLESREIHRSDFRFLLQYLHHFVSAYVGLYHTLTVLEVSPQSGSSGKGLGQIIGVSDEDRARLVDVFRQSVLPLLLPSGSVPAEMTSMLDTLLSKAWEDKRKMSVVTDLTCQDVAHGVAALFVRHSHDISARAWHSYLNNRESQALLKAFTTKRAFLGALGGYVASTKLQYWERLRLLLPFGPSLPHRERRRELYLWMDRRQRGYLTISDLAGGLMDLVQLQSFRVDFTPALLRAFTATTEMSGEHGNVVYLTQKSEERVLLPGELDAFLTYLYRYLELYFMFDVLTCGGHVHPETLHVVQKKQSYSAKDVDDEGPTSELIASAPANISHPAESATRTSIAGESVTPTAPRSGAAALLEAAKNPYRITLEAAPMKKEITLVQFCMGRRLLRKWGAHVVNPSEVFYKVSNRLREADAMSFIEFAIWASEHDLHPEGYGYGYDDAVDAITTMEEEYALQ